MSLDILMELSGASYTSRPIQNTRLARILYFPRKSKDQFSLALNKVKEPVISFRGLRKGTKVIR